MTLPVGWVARHERRIALLRSPLILRSAAKRRVSKDGNAHLACRPSFETALRASSDSMWRREVER